MLSLDHGDFGEFVLFRKRIYFVWLKTCSKVLLFQEAECLFIHRLAHLNCIRQMEDESEKDV